MKNFVIRALINILWYDLIFALCVQKEVEFIMTIQNCLIMQVINYYSTKGVVASLHAEKPPKEVTSEVKHVLSSWKISSVITKLRQFFSLYYQKRKNILLIFGFLICGILCKSLRKYCFYGEFLLIILDITLHWNK